MKHKLLLFSNVIYLWALKCGTLYFYESDEDPFTDQKDIGLGIFEDDTGDSTLIGIYCNYDSAPYIIIVPDRDVYTSEVNLNVTFCRFDKKSHLSIVLYFLKAALFL